MAAILLQIGVIYFLGHLFNFLFMKYKIPDVLLFMLLGVVIGPIMLLSCMHTIYKQRKQELDPFT